MVVDILIFLTILVPTSILVYKILKTITKVIFFGIAIFIAYLLLKFLLL